MSEVMLAKEYVEGVKIKKDIEYSEPPVNWIGSEKFDGVRATFRYVDGEPLFLSRTGKQYHAPKWFSDNMPPKKLLKNDILDGELWAGRDKFEMMGAVRKKVPVDDEWGKIVYMVYDIINDTPTFIERLRQLKKYVSFCKNKWDKKADKLGSPYNSLVCPIQYTEQVKITSVEMMEKYYQNILEKKGEGIMIKHPLCPYEKGRTSYLFKYKPAFDREAIIIGYTDGKGKYNGKLGAFECKPLINFDTYQAIDEDPSHKFSMSGMDDEIRNNYKETHPMGTIVSFECSGYTGKGVPRFARYLRIRTDVKIKKIVGDIHVKKCKLIFAALEEDAKYNDNKFQLRVYTNVMKILSKISDDSELMNISQYKGVGKGVKEKIEEIMETGTCSAYEKIKNLTDDRKKEIKAKQLFMDIHGVGPQHANKLIKAGFLTIEDLKKEKDISKYLNDVQKLGLKFYKDMNERIPYKEIQNHEKYLKMVLEKVDDEAELTIAGSYRRKKKTSGDIDILLKGGSRKVFDNFIEALELSGYLVGTFAKGTKKYMGMGVFDSLPRRIDIMYTKPDEYPFAVLYFTGSSEFNQRMRTEVLGRGLSLNEYSLKHVDTKKKVDHEFNNEKDIFDYLGYKYLAPEDRIS